LHRIITMAPDGSDLRLLECTDHPLPQLAADFDPNAVGTFDYEKSEWQISHPLWRQDGEIIVWGPHAGRIGYHLYQDRDAGEVRLIGDGVLTENGHMTFSPVNPRWLLSDTYPDSTTNERILFLFDMDSGQRHDVGSFYADPKLSKENRCDLHPRWRPDGLQVSIDSMHEQDREMYVMDVSHLVQQR
jgi:Tol biopolymer transport system component